MSIITDIVRAFKRPVYNFAIKKAFEQIVVGPGKPLRASFDGERVNTAYRTNEVVFASIEVASQALVDPRLKLERFSKNIWQEETEHPAIKLARRPFPDADETALVRWAFMSAHLHGRVAFEKVGATESKPPVELRPLVASRLSPIVSEAGQITGWEYTGKKKVTLQPYEIMVWNCRPNPANPYDVVSPLGVAMGSVDGDSVLTSFVNAFFEGGAQPAGLLTVKDRTLTDEEAEALRQKWAAKFDPRRGGSNKDIAVLDINATYEKTGSDIKEIQSGELRSILESRICMVFGMPPLIIYSYFGLVNAKYSNLKEAWAQFWDSKLTPWLKEFSSWLTSSLLRDFEDDPLIDGGLVRFGWDMSNVAALAADVDAVATRTREDWKANLLTRNQVMALRGIVETEDGDVYYNDVVNPRLPSASRTDDDKSYFPSAQRKAKQPPPEDIVIRVDNSIEKLSSKMKSRVEEYLLKEYEAGASAVEKDDPFDGKMDKGPKIQRVSEPYYNAAMRVAYANANYAIGDADVTIYFDPDNPRVKEIVDDLLQKVSGVSDTTREEVRDILSVGLKDGKSVDQIAREIREKAPQLSKLRAETIARTEMADAHTRASLLAYEESGVVSEVEWNATLDERTSDVCRALNGKRVPLGGTFPGGFRGPPAHPNCRSVLIPIVD